MSAAFVMVLAAIVGASECDESPVIAPAPAGLEIIYERFSVAQNGVEIQSTEHSVSHAVEINFPPDGGAPFKNDFAERKIWGVIPVSAEVTSVAHPEFNFSRKRTFDDDPATQLAGMKPGETRTILSRETFMERGMSFSEGAPITATFLGCATEDVAGKPERVAKYEIAIATLLGDLEGKKAPSLRSSVWTYSISERLGWVVKMERGEEIIRAKSVKEP